MPIAPTRILVPIDFSPLSFKAWDLACHLSQATGAFLEAIFVYEIPLLAKGLWSPMPLTRQVKVQLVQRLRGKICRPARVSVREGEPVEEILDAARRRSADLIVMGTRGRTGMARAVFGSVAEGLTRLSPIPVITVREEWKPIRRVLAPLNFMSYSLSGLISAAEIAETLGAGLDILFVAAGPFDKEKLNKSFDSVLNQLPGYFLSRKPELIVRTGDPPREILAVSAKYDLIALAARRKRLLKDWVLDTTTERVLRYSRVPVLSLPAAARIDQAALADSLR